MEEKVSTARVALKYGVLGAVVTMVYTTIINVSGLSQNQVLMSLSFIFTIAAIVMGMKEFRAQNKGFMSYGEGLGLGTLLSAVMGFLVSMFSTFYNKFIDPTIVTNAMDKARSDMELRGMDDAQIDQSLEVVQKFMSPGVMFAMGVFMSVLIGFIVSLVISAILRREKPVFE
jgi:hypothetical protein